MKKKEITINRIDSEQQMSDIRRRVKSKTAQRRHNAPKNHMNAKKKRIMIASIVLSALLIIGIIVWGISRIGFNLEQDPNILVDDIVEDKVSVLLVGSDRGGYNTDTMMLALMDCKNHTLNIMSIPRDTRVPNPYGGKGHSKINSVYAANGMSGLIAQIGEITGLPVNFYVKVDFEGFREAIDTLGGVQFDVPMRLKYDDPAQNLHIDLQAGSQLLDGSKAEQLVRSRNQYPEADIKRTEIQREFLKEAIKQHATAKNLLKVGDLYNIMSKYVTTNITLGDALKYAPSLTKISDENIQMFILPGMPAGDGSGDWLYNAQDMETLANNVFWYDVKVRPTPRPSSKPNRTSAPTSTPTQTSTPKPTADSDDDSSDNKPSTPRPTPSESAKPTATPSPTAVPSTATPKPTATPTPAPATPKPTSTPAQNNPGDYPDGI